MKVITLEENIKPKVIISEFKALYESCSEYIIGMHEAFYRDSSLHLVIEYMNCGSLEDLYKTCSTIPESVLSKITAKILKGIIYLHDEKKLFIEI